MLSLSDALDLYLTMKPYLPSDTVGLEPIDFIQVVLDNIIQANKHALYLEIIAKLNHSDIDTIIQFPPSEALSICIQGLVENRIYEMIDFFGKKLGL